MCTGAAEHVKEERTCQWAWRPGRIVAALCLVFVVLVAIAALSAPAAFAAGTSSTAGNEPIISWDASMIYAGQNDNNPWGPVGENAIVHGAHFPPRTTLRLVLAPGDSNSDPAQCLHPAVTIPGTVITDASGNFTQNFLWPAEAGQVNQNYSICSLLASTNTVASRQDGGPFTVLTASPPSISISETSITAGRSVTVTGQNWVPPQQVSIIIATCAGCSSGVVVSNTAMSSGQNSGTFSSALTIPTTAAPGSYVIDARTSTDLDVNNTNGAQHLTITAAAATPTPTPTTQPSPTPSPTITATATAQATLTAVASPTPAASATTGSTVTTTTNGSAGTNDTGTSSGSKGAVLLVLVALAMMFFLIAAVILVALLMRRKRAAGAAAATNPPYAYFMQPTQVVQAPINSMPTEAYSAIYIPQQVNAQYRQPPDLPICPNCGRPLVPNLPACSVCGMPLIAMRR